MASNMELSVDYNIAMQKDLTSGEMPPFAPKNLGAQVSSTGKLYFLSSYLTVAIELNLNCSLNPSSFFSVTSIISSFIFCIP